MSTYSVFEARNSLSRLIAEARQGGEVVIANRGEAVVRLVPVAEDHRSSTGAGFAEWLKDHPVPERLRASSAELDEQIEAARNAWE